MENYQYSTIDRDGDTIRLVHLLKGRFESPIECRIFTGFINDFWGSYSALSYTWGSHETPLKITVDGCNMHVTSNLHSALQHLRSEFKDEVFWIDAICIDQRNEQEKNHQVARMGLIYAKAEQVIIWLGNGTDKTDFAIDAMRFLEEGHLDIMGDWRPAAHIWMDFLNPESIKWNVNYGMQEIMRRSWFRRIWILQEVANAKVATVVCGTKSVSAKTFAQFPPLIGLYVEPHCQAVLDIMPGFSRQESWWNKDRSLRNLLLRFKDSEASDWRDKVYALVGISSDAYTSSLLVPDYGISAQQMFQKVIFFWFPQLIHDRSLLSPYWDWSEVSNMLYVLKYGQDLAESPSSSVLNHRYTLFTWPLSEMPDALLYVAAKKGDEKLVHFLLENGELDVNWAHEDKTSLIEACHYGHSQVVDLLISAEMEESFDDSVELTKALYEGRTEIINLLLGRGASVIARDKLGHTALLRTLKELIRIFQDERTRSSKTQRKAIRGSFSISDRSSFKQTLETNIDSQGHTNKVYTEYFISLVTRAVDLERTLGTDYLPLLWAAEHSLASILKILLAEGANINARDSVNRTTLIQAAKDGNDKLVGYLLKYGPDISIRDHHNFTALLYAALGGYDKIVQMLLMHGADINEHNCRATALWFAILKKHKTTVKYLLTQGADCNFQTSDGRTALILASEGGDHSIVELLLENGADVDPRSSSSGSPLMWACANGNESVIYSLLKANAELNIQDPHGNTALWWLRNNSKGHKEIERILIEKGALAADSAEEEII